VIRAAALAAWLLAAAAPAPAAAQGLQPGRIAVEAVAAVSNSSQAADDPFVFLDLTTTMRVNESMDIIVRPYARRLPGGDWDALLYQAEIRYQPIDGLRLEAGIMSSPLGLGTLELRQDVNPGVASVFYYFSPLPSFDPQADRVQTLSGGYPIGVILSSSGSWWDVRGGVTDGTPARYRKVFAQNNPAAAPQLIAGGGITPLPGLRFGVGLAHGAYRNAEDDYYVGSTPLPDANATVFNVEGEYAFGYTRLTGEWVRDRFESTTTPAVARSFYVQGVQTLTPRIFATGRITRVSAPVSIIDHDIRSTRSSIELSAGYRLTPQWTVKGGYEAARRFNANDWTHAATASVVWARRWF
jgi:hypothetical protein